MAKATAKKGAAEEPQAMPAPEVADQVESEIIPTPEPATEVTHSEQPVQVTEPASAGRPLSAALALEEPQRTEVLNAYLESGVNFRLRTKTGKTEELYHYDIPGSKGKQVFLTVTAEGKAFAVGTACHLLRRYPEIIEEIPGQPE
jgi:hypothetical protein